MTEPADRLSAALSGRYRVKRQLGEGGMATVYLAEDEKHDRKVALKVLKPELAAVIGADRFVSEIKTTAQLQHPHILPLFDSGEADGFLYYVMPYIEGETLREKLDQETQLGVEESVRIARDVADALDYAHKQGVIHRDIKPENILLHEGRPVVADFGIALAISAAGGGRLTETGLSLGTPHYMSPEQATADRDLNPRSDVYSLGCVLYEMLAGDPPHTGPTAQAILMGILTETPRSVTELRRSVPPNVSAAVAKAIEKLPADRFESAHAFIEALENESFSYAVRKSAATPADAVVAAPQAARPTRSSLVPILGVVALAFATLAAIGWLDSEDASPRVIRTDLYLGDVALAPGERVEVSPDGSTFAFVGVSGGRQMLYVRHADEPGFRAIPGTEGARQPSFSPNGDWLVYRDDPNAALLKVSISGGNPLTVVARGALNPFGASWGDDGTIVFGGPTGPHRVPETGGVAERLPGTGQPSHLLPGGRGVLLTVGASRIDLIDLATDSVRMLIPEGVGAIYVRTGHILYVHPRGGLQAVAFDLDRLEVTGQPVPVLDEVERRLRGRLFSISEEGTLAYVTGRGLSGGTASGQTLVVADLGGNVNAPALEPRLWGDPRYSPDGRFVAYSSGDNARNIFIYDIELGTAPRQLTFEGNNFDPVWSPDGSRLVFSSAREGTEGEDLFIKSVVDDSPEVKLLTWPADQEPRAWPGDDLLLFQSENTAGAAEDLWLLDPAVDGAEPTPYLESEATIRTAAISRDGRFAAYDSDENGERVVYVRSFPQPRQQSRVSAGSGRSPRWSPDGDAIYYFNCCTTQDTVFVARVQTEPSFAVLSTEVVLTGVYQGNTLDLHPDGDRLLMVSDQGAPAAAGGTRVAERHIVVFNWFEELKERLGGGD
jgi:serine/threonine-protein kinase